jgi:hypothetical protein
VWNSRLMLVVALQCLQLPLIPSKWLTVEFAISNLLCNLYAQWPMSTDAFYLHFLFIISIHMTRIKKDLPVDCRLDSWWWLLAKTLKVICWHDQSNQSYSRYNVFWHHFIWG